MLAANLNNPATEQIHDYDYEQLETIR